MLYDLCCPRCYRPLLGGNDPPLPTSYKPLPPGITLPLYVVCPWCTHQSHLITGRTVEGDEVGYYITTGNKFPKDLPEQIRRDYEVNGPMICGHKLIGNDILVDPEGERNWDLWKQKSDGNWHCVKGIMKRDPATGKRYPRPVPLPPNPHRKP